MTAKRHLPPGERGHVTLCNVKNKCYRGPAPLSAPETVDLQTFLSLPPVERCGRCLLVHWASTGTPVVRQR